MKIYALKAHGERGKSTTLKMLFIKACDKFKTTVIYKENIYCELNRVKADITQEKADRRAGKKVKVHNIIVVLKINNKIVGIASAGDNKAEVDKGFNVFKKFNCDIAFCACRGKGETITYLEQLKLSGTPVDYIDKSVVLNAKTSPYINDIIDYLNDYQAEELTKVI